MPETRQLATRKEIMQTKEELLKEISLVREDLLKEIHIMRADLNKTIYTVGLIQFLAILGSVIGIIVFMLR